MNHLSQIADKLSQYDLDAMLIVSEPGERYAVGFQGEGYVLVTREGSQYSTDGRYIEAAQKQVTGAEVVLTSRERSHLALARDFLAACGSPQMRRRSPPCSRPRRSPTRPLGRF